MAEGVKIKKVYFYNNKKQKLAGILEESNIKKEEVVIMVHGYSANKDVGSIRQIAEELSRKNINSFRIDLDGCGESEGKFEEQTITSSINDTISAIELMKKEGYTKIDLFGLSAGGLTVMATALKYPEINKIALGAPVSDYPSQRLKTKGQKYIDEWREKGYNYRESWDGRKIRVNYSFYEDSKNYVMYDKVKNIKCPVLIVHGTADDKVDLEDSKKVIKGFPDGKLIILKDADHFLRINEDRIKSIKLFVDWFEGKIK